MCIDGVLKVIGNGYQKHHDNNVKDGQFSIAILRSGSSGV